MTWVRNSGGHQIRRIPGSTSFFTPFTGNENPLSEGGNWNGQPEPVNFTNPVRKNGGAASDGGSSSGTNDAFAILNAFTPTTRVRATATLEVNGAIGSGEVELHFNSVVSGTSVKLYEIDAGNGGIFGVVKWNGAQGDVTFLTHTAGTGNWVGSVPPVTGDLLIAERTISGGTVHFDVFHVPLSSGTKTLIYSAEDDGTVNGAIYTTGKNGIGFDAGTPGVFAFSDYLAENF